MNLAEKMRENYFVFKFYHKTLRLKDNLRKLKYDKYSTNKKMEILSNEYKEKTGERLDWNNIHSFTEKIQWAKLFDTSPLKTQLADKYLVREWVSNKIGENYLIPLLGVWDTFDEIDFSKLPSKFVLKTNNASGTNIIVEDKEKWI